jgi:hypothetical protein
VVNYCIPQSWRETRAAIIGEWLQTEARYLARRATNDRPPVLVAVACRYQSFI